MKNFVRGLVLVSTVLFAFTFVACSSPVSPSNESSEWSDVTDKSDLIGTWKAEFYEYGEYDINTIYVGSNYWGYLKKEIDYSGMTAEYQSYIPSCISQMENAGFSCTHNTATKKITAILNFDSSDLDYVIIEMDIKINSSKNKIKLTTNGSSAVYTKQ